jgi:hypothetical protein
VHVLIAPVELTRLVQPMERLLCDFRARLNELRDQRLGELWRGCCGGGVAAGGSAAGVGANQADAVLDVEEYMEWVGEAWQQTMTSEVRECGVPAGGRDRDISSTVRRILAVPAIPATPVLM